MIENSDNGKENLLCTSQQFIIYSVECCDERRKIILCNRV